MLFSEINENFTIDDILKVIEDNRLKAVSIRSEIERLTKFRTIKPEIIQVNHKSIVEKEFEEEKDDEFEDMIGYYLDDYKNYSGPITVDDLLEIMPSRSNYQYNEIIMRLQAESLKEIKELEELSILENDRELLLEIQKSILLEQKKIVVLREILQMDTKKILSTIKKNKLYLAPNIAGKIMIIDDLEHIPTEYYAAFLELINSITNNTFKGVKRLNGDSFYGISICEVRGDGIRILFHRLNNDTYGLITAFVKKTNTSRGYKEFIRNKVSIYKNMVDYIRESLGNESLLEENESNVLNLYNLLQKKDSKTLKIGDLK